MALESLQGWTPAQRHAVAAAFLAWTLDAFDFFVLVLVMSELSANFHVAISRIGIATTLTLAFRPLGAFIFGRFADRYGRRPVLMVNVAIYSLSGFATAFAPDLVTFLVVRALFGIAMGGVWGIGGSLAMETIPARARGFVSGLLQSGYPCGYLVAAVVFGLLDSLIGWRGMFMVGILPAIVLIAYIAAMVPESPGFDPARARASGTIAVLRSHWKIALYAIVLMTGFNFFSHGTQDLYPTFLTRQHHFDHAMVSTITVVLNIGAVVGGLLFGSFSQRIGRRKAVVVAALLALPVAWFWAFSEGPALLALGAFLMQVCVQGAWGVVPVHLNELSPAEARGTFPGTCYQLGNLIASVNGWLQPRIAEQMGGNYSMALAGVAVAAALAIAVLMWLGPEARDADMAA